MPAIAWQTGDARGDAALRTAVLDRQPDRGAAAWPLPDIDVPAAPA
jgi:hypothetical protein